MTMKWRCLALSLFVLLGACAQKTVFTAPGNYCEFQTLPLEVAVPRSQDDADATTPSADPIVDDIEKNLDAMDSAYPRHSTPQFLALSGGSEEGAFGAGVLSQWAQGGHLPAFDVVTGISTGAILSTFAFIDQPQSAVDGYSITEEKRLLKRLYKRGGGDASIARALIQHGAVADLSPLQDHLGQYITEAMMDEVGVQSAKGRRLYIGAVDMDSGQATAFNLGEMAERFHKAATDSPQRKHYRDCYLRAILASSSAPIAAAPVFLDNRMYVDGGVRFGLFSDKLVAVGERRRLRQQQMLEQWQAEHPARRSRPGLFAAAAPPPQLPGLPVTTAIVNGTMDVLPPEKCPKVDPALCTPADPTGGLAGARRKWRFSDLAMRTERLLVNQVYRFSAASVETAARGGNFRFMRIRPDWAKHPFALDGETKTCGDWLAMDRTIEDPVQFHWRYMRCMIDYGRARARAAGLKADPAG